MNFFVPFCGAANVRETEKTQFSFSSLKLGPTCQANLLSVVQHKRGRNPYKNKNAYIVLLHYFLFPVARPR